MDRSYKSNYVLSINLFIDSITFLIVGWINNGILRFVPFYNYYIVFGLFFIWLLIVCLYKSNFLSVWINHTYLLLLFIFTTVFSSVFIYKQLEGKLMNLCFLLIIYSIFLYITEYKNHSFMKFLFLFILIDRVLIALNTLRYLTLYPDFSRDLAAGYRSVEAYTSNLHLLGGFQFVFSSVVILIYFTIIFQNFKSKYKFIIASYMIVTFVFLFKASYSTAILLAMIFCTFGLIMKKNKLIKSILLSLLIIISYSSIISLIYFIIQKNILNVTLNARLKLIADVLTGKSIEGTTLSVRWELYSKSMKTFTSSLYNILIGVYETPGAYLKIGHHSEWLDSLALFGVIRYSFIILFLYLSFKKLLKNTSSKRAINYVTAFFVIVGFLNPIMFMEVFLVVYIFIYCSKVIERPVELVKEE